MASWPQPNEPEYTLVNFWGLGFIALNFVVIKLKYLDLSPCTFVTLILLTLYKVITGQDQLSALQREEVSVL